MRRVRNLFRGFAITIAVLLIVASGSLLSETFDWRAVSAVFIALIVLTIRLGARTMEPAPKSLESSDLCIEKGPTPQTSIPPTEPAPKSLESSDLRVEKGPIPQTSIPPTEPTPESLESSDLRVEKGPIPQTSIPPTELYLSVELTYDDGEVFEHVRSNINTRQNDYAIGTGEAAKLRFIDHQLTEVIHGREIRGPIYLADLKKLRGDQYPAVVDPKLNVKWQGQREPLPYWPNYKNASAAQRGTYIAWLADDRGSIEEVGYAFLYFYGLERYVLQDAKTDDPDQRTSRLRFIFSELQRLQLLFPHSRSFQGYSERLMEAIAIRFLPEALQRLKAHPPERDAAALRYHLAELAESGSTELLDSDWVIQWLIYAGELPQSKSLKAHYQSFCSVFQQLYAQTSGIIVPKSRTKLRLSYEPASSGLQGLNVYDHITNWCDPSALKRPLKAAIALVPHVQEIFKALVRARTADSPFDTLAHWPSDQPLDDDPRYQSAKKGIDGHCEQHPTSSLRTLSTVAGQRLGEKVSKPQARALRNALATCGWVMVPDPDLTPMTLKPDHPVELYRGTPPKGLSSAGAVLGLNLRLGAAIAVADGSVQDEEVVYLQALVARHIDPDEQAYLGKLLTWHLNTPASGAGLKAEIAQLGETSRDELAKRLIKVATADGNLPKSELQALEKTFDRLRLPKTEVARLLTESPRETSTVDHPSHPRTGCAPAIIARPTSAANANPSPEPVTERGIVLDPSAIAATQAATKDIQSVLGEIFGDAEAEQTLMSTADAEDSARTAHAPDSEVQHWHNGDLDDTQHQFLSHLVSKASWTRSELEAYCHPLGLLMDGTLEAINEAAFEHLGDQLVELDEPLLIYHDLLPTEEA